MASPSCPLPDPSAAPRRTRAPCRRAADTERLRDAAQRDAQPRGGVSDQPVARAQVGLVCLLLCSEPPVALARLRTWARTRAVMQAGRGRRWPRHAQACAGAGERRAGQAGAGAWRAAGRITLAYCSFRASASRRLLPTWQRSVGVFRHTEAESGACAHGALTAGRAAGLQPREQRHTGRARAWEHATRGRVPPAPATHVALHRRHAGLLLARQGVVLLQPLLQLRGALLKFVANAEAASGGRFGAVEGGGKEGGGRKGLQCGEVRVLVPCRCSLSSRAHRRSRPLVGHTGAVRAPLSLTPGTRARHHPPAS